MMRRLQEIFPELQLISDQALAHKALLCWQEALSAGGWESDDLEKIPFTLLIPDCRISLATHIQAVTQTAVACARIFSQFYHNRYTINMDHLVVGALLHDIGKLLEYQRDGNKYIKSRSGRLLRHPFSGAGLAMKHELPDEIIHIIASHAREGDEGYRSPEAVIVHHADFMNFEPLKNL
jgi:putative nucleotidyltransferase with HDIG domain